MSTNNEHETYIAKFLDGVKKMATEVSHEEISKVIDCMYDCWQNGHAVFLIGNGGSAGTASHFACDLNKVTACKGKKRFKAVSLVDNVSLITALVNDEGWDHLYTEQLKNHFSPGDVVCAFSVHGGSGSDHAGLWSQNILAAFRYAKEHGGKTIGIAGFGGGAFKQYADHCIVVPFDTTPHVESFHVVLHHLIAFRLRELIERDGK